tara:strand:- start:2964 stop:11540 length:8577 start_codon:yes stop_codon:yes gene_type:complete
MGDLQQLFDVLTRDGYYTKSFEDFKVQFQDVEYQDKVFEVVSRDGLYTNDKPSFLKKYGVKKKDSTQLPVTPPLQDGESPGAEVVEEQVLSDTPQVIPNIERNAEGLEIIKEEPKELKNENIVEEIVAYDPREQGKNNVIKYDKTASEFDKSLAYITPDLIDREEEEVVARMKYHFGDYGFKFEEGGGFFSGFNGMTVVADNGKTLTVDLDPIMGDVFGGQSKGSRELIAFLKANRRTDKELETIYADYDINRKKYFSAEAAKEDIQDISDKANLINKRTKAYLARTTVHEQAMDLLLQSSPEEKATEAWKIAYNNQLQQGKILSEIKSNISSDVTEYKKLSSQINSSVGNYMDMKASENSSVIKGIVNKISGGISKGLKSVYGTGVEELVGKMQSLEKYIPGMVDPIKAEYRKKRSIEIAKDLGYNVPEGLLKDKKAYDQWIAGLKNLDPETGKDFSDTRKIYAEGESSNAADRLNELVLDDEIKSIKKPGKEAIDYLVREPLSFDDVSDEAFALQQQNSIIVEGLAGLAESAPALALTLLSRGRIKATGPLSNLRNIAGKYLGLSTKGQIAQTIGFSLLQAESMNEEMNLDPDFKFVTEAEKKKIVLPTAITVGILERFGVRNIVGNKTIMTGIMNRAVNMLPKGANATAFKIAITKIVKNDLARGLYSNKAVKATGILAKATLAEAETGAAQQFAEIGYKDIWNNMNNKDMFDIPELWSKEFYNEIAHAAAAEAVGGFVMGVPQAMIYDYNKNKGNNISDETLELFDMIRGDNITKQAYEKKLDLEVANGNITKKEAAKQLLDFNVLEGAANSLPIDLDSKSRKEALGLVFEKQNLESEMEKIDKDLGSYKVKEKRVNEITEQLNKIGSNQAQDNADLSTEEEGISEANLVTEEEAVVSLEKKGVKNPTVEQIKNEQDALQIESTEKMVSEKSPESGGEVGQNVLNPKSTDKGKTKGKGANDKKSEEEVTPEERGDIDAFYGENVSESVETPTSNLSINNKQEKGNELKNTKLAQRIIRIAKKGAKAISKIAPNVKIVLHKSNKEFEKFAPKGRGYYNSSSGVIHINLTTAKTSTVAHEIFHAVFMQKIKAGDKGAIVAANKLIASVRKTLPKNSILAKRIDNFTKEYNGQDIKNEEELAELFGIMASEYTSLNKPSKNKVIEFIRKIAKKFGINIPSNFTSTDEGVVDFLNTFSSKVREGKVIEENDLITLDEINEQIEKEGTAPIGNPTEINKPQKGRQQKINFDKNYPLSLVTPDKKIDINSLIDDIADKKEKVWFWVADQLGLGEVDGVKMDAGPSFPLQPENLKKKAIWASGLDDSKLSKNIKAADYIFIISGSPETSKLFNKKVFDKYANDLGDFEKFAKDALATKPTKAIKEALEEFDSWPAMRRSPKRKNFLIGVNEQSKKPNTNFHALIKSLGGFVDLQSLRDGFYKDNQFAQNDIMMVLKPTGLGGNSNHSTYSTDILGEVVGVPDTKINAREIVPEEIKRKIDGTNISMQTSSIAPYGGSTKTAVKTITKPQKGRQQKITEDIIILQTYMPNSGYYSKQADVSDIQRQWNKIGPGYKAIRAPEGAYGSGGGIYVLNPGGKIIKPKRQGRQQKMDNQNDLLKIIIVGREEAGFRDAAIKDYLQRRKKTLDGKSIPEFKSAEINNAFEILDNIIKKSDYGTYLFTEYPKSFNNIEGGFLAGLKLMRKINSYYKRILKANEKKKSVTVKGTPLNEEQIREKVIEYFTSLTEYKNEGAEGGKLTSQQMAMEKDMLEMLIPDPLRANPLRIKAINKRFSEIKFDEKNLKAVQRELRNYIRQVLPRTLYTKGEITKLIDKVNRINKTNFESVKDEVFKDVTIKTNKSLQTSILKILDKSYRVIQSGRLKGVKIDNETRKKLDRIKAMIVDPKSTSDQITAINEKLLKEYNEVSKEEIESGITDTDSRSTEITIAMQINISFSEEMNDPNKTTLLSTAISNLNQIEETGKSILEYQLLEDAIKYRKNERIAHEQMTGVDLDAEQSLIDQGIDKSDITEGMINKEFAKMTKDISLDQKRSGGLKASTVKARFKGVVLNTLNKLENIIIGTAEDLSGLIDRISTQPGEIFGGPLNEIVSESIRASSRVYKARMLNQQIVFGDKMTELFGNKWVKVNRKNSQETETLIISEAKNKNLLDQIAEIEKQNPVLTNELKDKINQINIKIDKNTLKISQNQLMYYYAQMQDPSLSESMINTFNPTGNFDNEFNSRIKKEIEDKLDPKLINFSKWMIEDYYPSVYEQYNQTYKAIYRTDMPWNQFYAGRVYRQNEEDAEGLDLLADSNSWITNVVAASSKARMSNSNPIQKVDGVDAMLNYTKDMEYFSAYAESIRDINKLFTSPAIKETIQNKFGSDIYKYINDSIQKIANKGVQNQRETKIISFFNNTFLFSRLGFNPTLILKQMTSFVTYGNDIGYRNWIKYRVNSLGKVNSTVKEIMANSVVLQDRYNQPISRAVENYSDSKFEKMNGGLLEQFGLSKQNLDTATKMLMWTTMVGDKGAIIFGGLPNYLYYKNQFKTKNPNATDQEVIDFAIKKFEADTLRTQQSYDLQDKDYYQTKGALVRAFNMFLTTPKQYFRREIIAARNMYRIVKSGGKEGKGVLNEDGSLNAWRSLTKSAKSFAIYHVVMPVLFQWVSQGLPGLFRRFDDEDKEELGMAALLGNINALFIVGQIAEGISDAALGKPWAGQAQTIPVLGQAAALGKLYKDMMATQDPSKKREKWNKLMVELIAVTGVPAPQLKKFAENWGSITDSNDFGQFVLKLFNFSQYAQGQKGGKGKPFRMTNAEKKKYMPALYEREQKQKERLENSPAFKRQQEFKQRQKDLRQRMLDKRYRYKK